MKCPKCEKRMFKNNNVWECSNCGFNFITTDDENIFTNMRNSNLSNKIKNYRENTEIGKVVDDIGEKISVQVKKEEAYIKTRKDNFSSAAFDENEFFISKYVFDGADFIKNKKEELDNSRNVKHPQKKQKINVDDVEKDYEYNSETVKQIEGTLNKEIGYDLEKVNKGKKIIEEHMGTLSFRNREFNSKISEYGVPTLCAKDVWKEINDQAKMELEEGVLELDNIPERLDQLLIEFGTKAKKINEGKKIINDYMGTSSFKKTEFNSKIRNYGIQPSDIKEVWKKINDQAKMELEEGVLELDNIPERLDQLLIEFGDYAINNPQTIGRIDKISKEAENRPENALFFVDGREATISVFDEFIQLDFTTNTVKKYLSGMGGVKKIYYPQINSIQKRDAGPVLLGSIEFEVPGMAYSGHGLTPFKRSENVIHYPTYYQNEIDKIYEFVNQKILNIQNSKTNPQTVSNETSALSEIKKAKELLDMGALTQEEFDKIKKDLLN